MNDISAEKKLSPSLMSCLIDDHPEVTTEAAKSSSVVLRQLRENVRADLENLLNTRISCVDTPQQMPLLEFSLLNYGLEDISTVNLESNKHVQQFCRKMENTIRHFEPRIKSIKVGSKNTLDVRDMCFHFRVEAVLHASPDNETIVFDSAINPMSKAVDVKESQR
jgi:type VI secretion system protein ImpF